MLVEPTHDERVDACVEAYAARCRLASTIGSADHRGSYAKPQKIPRAIEDIDALAATR
jgi:hypothetical protein